MVASVEWRSYTHIYASSSSCKNVSVCVSYVRSVNVPIGDWYNHTALRRKLIVQTRLNFIHLHLILIVAVCNEQQPTAAKLLRGRFHSHVLLKINAAGNNGNWCLAYKTHIDAMHAWLSIWINNERNALAMGDTIKKRIAIFSVCLSNNTQRFSIGDEEKKNANGTKWSCDLVCK